MNWPSWITKLRAQLLLKQNGLFLQGRHDRSVCYMRVSASDLKSEVKLDEKRETLVHKRKMLGLELVNMLGRLHSSKITVKKRIVCCYNQ